MSYEHRQSVEGVGRPYANLFGSRTEDLIGTLTFINANLTGTPSIRIGYHPDTGINQRLLSKNLTYEATEVSETYQAMIDACIIGESDIPACDVATDTATRRSIILSVTVADIATLPLPDQLSKPSVFYYQIFVAGRVIAEGDLVLTLGVP